MWYNFTVQKLSSYYLNLNLTAREFDKHVVQALMSTKRRAVIGRDVMGQGSPTSADHLHVLQAWLFVSLQWRDSIIRVR